MKKDMTTLTSDSQKLLIETVRQLEKIISTTESDRREGVSKREGTLFFPAGIGYISLTVKVPSVGEVTLTISGQYTAKTVSEIGDQ